MQCSPVQWGIFLLGGGNLMKSNFEHSGNCYLMVNEPLVGGGQKFAVCVCV